jgi:ERCC4-type nuclease
MISHFRYSDKDIKELLSTLVIIIDSREKKNSHIVDYLRRKEVQFRFMTLKTGDYSACLPQNEKFGIVRDLYFSASIERKNGVDELVESIKDRSRFENELIRSTKHPFRMIVEELNGYEKILKGEYRSKYKPESLLGSLKTFENRYNFTTVFLAPNTSGNYILHHFLYMAREQLKGGIN